MIKKILVSLCLLTTGCSLAWCQSSPISISLDLDYDTVQVGETFTVKYTLKNTRVTDFDCPAFKDFVLVAGPSTSLMSSEVNGHKSQTLTYTYYLSTNYPGTFLIPSAKIETANGPLKSSALKIVVVELLSSPRPPTQDNVLQSPFDQNDFFDDSFFNTVPNSGQSIDEMMEQFDAIFEASPFDLNQSIPHKDYLPLDDLFMDKINPQSMDELMKTFENLYNLAPDSLKPKTPSKQKNKKKEKTYKI